MTKKEETESVVEAGITSLIKHMTDINGSVTDVGQLLNEQVVYFILYRIYF